MCSPSCIFIQLALNNNYRTTELISPCSCKAAASNKPAGLAGSMKAATIIHSTVATTQDEDEPIVLTDAEVDDDLGYSASSNDSLV